MYIKRCKTCGRSYEAKRSDSKTCSKKCRQNMSKRKSRKSFKIKTCAHCFTQFNGPNNQLYCNDECAKNELKIATFITRLTNKAIVNALKENGCSKCSTKVSSVALDFHHEGGKQEHIGQLMAGNPIKLMKELSKCIVVCANCHRELTHGKTFTIFGIEFER